MYALGKALTNKISGKSTVDNAKNPTSAYSMMKRKDASKSPVSIEKASGYTKRAVGKALASKMK